MSIIEKVKRTIEKYAMISHGDKIIVGVSGGPDSVCLLDILNRIKDEYNISLYAAHINHNMRGETADQDALYVERLATDLGMPFFLLNKDVKGVANEKGISLEVAGRQVRYDFFLHIARQVGANKIAVAHNMNDQAETILMRFIRGTGLEGLAGIKPVREDGVIRPVLELTRDEIEEYCRVNSLNPRTDESNLEGLYTRNKLRLGLIPKIIEDFNPNFIYTATNNADIIRGDNQFIDEHIENLLEGKIEKDVEGISIPLNMLLEQCHALQRRILRKAIHILNGDTVDISYKHIEQIIKIISCFDKEIAMGGALDLPGDTRIEIRYDRVFFIRKRINSKKDGFIYLLKIDKPIFIPEAGVKVSARIVDRKEFKNIKFSKFIKAFDYNKINEEIYIRNRISGDKFTPSGMKGTKKLKDFFIDLKIPKNSRDNIPLVVAGKDILWVVGYRTNEKYKCLDTTEDILIIEFSGGKDR